MLDHDGVEVQMWEVVVKVDVAVVQGLEVEVLVAEVVVPVEVVDS